MSYGAKYLCATLICVAVCVCAFAGAYALFNKRENPSASPGNEHPEQYEAGFEAPAAESAEPTQAEETPEAKEAVTTGERINANTKIIYEYYYAAEDRLEKVEQYAPEALINLTRGELIARIEGFGVESFSSDEVVLRKNISKSSNKKYIIGEWEGRVAVFYGNGEDSSIKEVTDTPVSSLSEYEQERLREGIIIESDAELMKVLEDYGS